MNSVRDCIRKTTCVGLVALSIGLTSAPAYAQQRTYHIPATSLSDALREFGRVSGRQIIFTEVLVRGKRAPALSGNFTPEEALSRLLRDSGLKAERTPAGALMIVPLPEEDSSNLQEHGTRISAAESEQTLDVHDQEIIVTGTRTRSGSMASPVISLSRDDFKRSDNTSVQDVLADIPANFNDFGITNQGNVLPGPNNLTTKNSAGGSSANIHGLGANATLALMNGIRLPNSAQGYTIDISSIPLLALERIDVLTDGASPVYGSEAIGGIVNLVTRSSIEGAETFLRFGEATQGGASELQAGQALGANWTSGGAFLAYEFNRGGVLKASDRPETASQLDNPADTLPRRRSHSAYATVKNEIGPLTLAGELLYFNRSSQVRVRGADGEDVSDSKDWQLLSTVRGTWALADGLRAQTYIRFARGALNRRARIAATESNSRNKAAEAIVGGSVDGDLIALPGGQMSFALGGEYRRQAREVARRSDADRNIVGLFGEMNLPLVGSAMQIPLMESFELSGALRYDHYSDFGGSTNYRVGALWGLNESLRLRGTISTSFRAPTLAESDTSSTGAYTADFFSDPLSTTNPIVLVASGSSVRPGTEPETARNMTIGADLSLGPISLHVTGFDVRFKNRIQSISAVVPELFSFGSPISELFIIRNPDPASVAEFLNLPAPFYTDYTGTAPTAGQIDILVDNRFRNIFSTKISGMDFAAEYEHEIGASTLRVTAFATYVDRFIARARNTVDERNLKGVVYSVPKFRGRIGGSWNNPSATLSAFLNYTSSFENTLVSPGRKISDWATVDLVGKFRIAQDFELTLSAYNLLDTSPPFVDSVAPGFYPNYDAANASVIGRFVAISLSKDW